MKILTTAQYKLDKSTGFGYKTVGLNLSPAHEAALVLKDPTLPTMCAMAGACASVCLAKTGMNVFPASVKARAARTKAYLDDPKTFLADVLDEIDRAYAKATRDGMKFAVRPNLLSDQRKLAYTLAKARPYIQFYDYTKLALGSAKLPPNYHLTYSASERTSPEVLDRYIGAGMNPAIVFDTPRNKPLPSHYTVLGRSMPVIDGDEHDLRFLDPAGAVVGLRWKGSKAGLVSGIAQGFVFLAEGGSCL